MNAAHIPQLATLLEAYFDPPEFILQSQAFAVDFPDGQLQDGSRLEWFRIATHIIENTEHGNTLAFLISLLDQLENRNDLAIARTDWERRTAHENLRPLLRHLGEASETLGAPSEIALPAGSGFSAKSRVRELLEQATGPIFVVDTYVGLGTLDCFRTIRQPIRLLTGVASNSMENGFDSALAAFQQEDRMIAVRRTAMLHDRHIVFNERCWLVGSSLKDAGRKAFNCIEVVDAKAQVIADLEAKWSAATPFA
jgi:hypothetical protein